MARIPEEEIDRIKRETDLAALVRSRGIELNKHGNGHLVGVCPFHDDEEPSFIVTPGKGLYHCMGCGAAGNAIQFVEKFDGVSFRHAFEVLNDGKAFTSSTDQPLKRTTVRKLETPFDPESSDAELFMSVVDYYHERLLKTPPALAYLKTRGLEDREAIEHFKIGFADRTLGLRLPGRNRKEGKSIRERLINLGLIRESGHEHFNGSVVLPVFDAEGHVAEIYGRKINDRLRKGTPMHLYLPGPHAGIWNQEACLATGEVILCEAPLDALTFWVNGIKNVTFIYGTEGFPDYLFNALIEQNIQTVRLAYDNDEAGNRAATRDSERLQAQGIEVFRIKFPHGMDVNEYANKVTPAAKSLAQAVKSAEWIGASHTRADASSSLVAIAANKEAACPEQSRRANLVANKKSTPIRVDPCSSVVQKKGEYYHLQLGSREYRVGGLEKNNSLEVMKVTVRLKVEDKNSSGQGSALFHMDSFDLCRDGDRRRYIERAAEETNLEKELIKRDLGKLLLALEEVQQERLSSAASTGNEELTTELTSEERQEALDFLQSPNLIEKISETFNDCGLVGEGTNRLAAYLACTSRKLDKPLAVIIQSTSAAGKSTLMEAVLAMFPEEESIKYSAMTGQSLYYLGETNLKHRILAIVEEEGAEKASYALKLLQSEGELTIASTGKDPHTGRMETQEYHVEGPVMIFLTTTAVEIDEELLNRCLVLTVDESREQTERIHQLQRQARTLEGLQRKKQRAHLIKLLRNVQRLLEPIDVVNPWADQLTFTAHRTRTRRDHEKYLTLIDAIALLHQHQRPISRLEVSGDAKYITVTLEDIELANRIAPELLGRSLDELPPQTRRVYEVVKTIVRERMDTEEIEQRLALFSRREVRQRLGWSITQVRAHLERLREIEYIAARIGRPGSAYQYELLTDCRETADLNHIGLLDVAQLRCQPVGKKEDLSAGCRDGGRQVKSPVKQCFSANLSACSERTSGTLAAVGS